MLSWYRHKLRWWLICLYPLSVMFAGISALRRWLYRQRLLDSDHPGVCCIVVGNISVGGNGKTPVVIALATHFQAKGYRPGILSRGYGGSCKQFPYAVTVDDSADVVGDEPLLMKLRTNVPVVIDPRRSRGAQHLVDRYNCDLILCDDGLQHYALRRDIELIVMDDRQLGNGHLLPMGPLREGAWRLATVDAIVHNGEGPFLPEQWVSMQQQHRMRLIPGVPTSIKDGRSLSNASELSSAYTRLEALAGIGNPQRFFDTLDALGVSTTKRHTFNDHHKFVRTDIPMSPVIMTEKDAVKVKAFAHPDAWYLPVSAALPQALYDKLDQRVSEFTSKEKIYGNKH